MIRGNRLVLLLVGLMLLSPAVGCEQDRKTAVLLTIDYRDVGPVDQFALLVYPADRFDDIGRQDIPETATVPFTGSESSTLLILPERWADRNLIIQVVAMYNGVGVGQGSELQSFPKDEVTELTLLLVEGAPHCGNGIQEALEQCDGDDPLDYTCQATMGLRDGVVRCTEHCLLDVSGCFECGNSSIEAAEECDSDDFGGITCADHFFDGGNLRCDPQSCTTITNECIGGCGNDLAEPGETCDGSDFGAQTCETVAGLIDGELACTPLCQLDISGCHECGNGAQEADEDCDGVAFGGLTCADFGFGGGELTCTTGCVIDTSSCCGDGLRGPGEVCDGTDFGARTCLTETGHTSGALACDAFCELDRSGCYTCGNGAVEGTEACDGLEFGGETCLSLMGQPGPLACAADCSFIYTAGCTGCGDGTVAAWEDCDDGNLTSGDGCEPDCTVQPGWSCDTSQPSVCTPDLCGNGVIDSGEVCDGALLGSETCLSRGFVSGGGTLSCNATCTSLDTSSCTGGVIQDAVDLQAAVDEAYASGVHREIAVAGPTFTLNASVVFDECSGTCVGGQPFGVTIRPLGDSVCFTPTGVFPAFDVVTGNNTFQELCFTDATAAIRLQNGADAGGNTLLRNLFDNSSTPPGQVVEVDSELNYILANRFVNGNPTGLTALIVTEDGNTIAMNVFSGYYDWTVMLHTFPVGPNQATFFDHNSIDIIDNGGGVFLNSATELCYRNNIVYGDGTTTGLFVAGNVAFATMAECAGSIAEANVNANHATLCDQLGCASYCSGSDPTVDLCDLTTSPGWSAPLLCLSGGNFLIDAAVTTWQGYDFNDSTPAVDYGGSGPDVGARESGIVRYYGGTSSSFASSCP